MKFLKSFLGVWSENGKKPQTDRRLKGSRTRKICPEGGKVQLGFKRVPARTKPRCLPARVGSERERVPEVPCFPFAAREGRSGVAKCERLAPSPLDSLLLKRFILKKFPWASLKVISLIGL